jgi:hypothetical protein
VDEKDLYDQPSYTGGDVAPADLWGAAPDRGKACEVIEKVLQERWGITHVATYTIVDALIEAKLLVDETNQKDRLYRRLRELRAEGRKITYTIEHEMKQLREETPDERWLG